MEFMLVDETIIEESKQGLLELGFTEIPNNRFRMRKKNMDFINSDERPIIYVDVVLPSSLYVTTHLFTGQIIKNADNWFIPQEDTKSRVMDFVSLLCFGEYASEVVHA